MRAVLIGLIAGIVAFALVSLAERTQRSAAATPDGWKRLRAGWLINGTIVAVTALAALIAVFLLSGGSTLPDAARQNGFAILLLAAFAASASYTAWATYGRTIAWKGDALLVRSLSGSESLKRISDIIKVKKSEMRGEYRITFRDGLKLWFSAHMHGANELLARLPRRAFLD